MSATTILLYSPTGGGKTTQIGTLAEDLFVKTGLKTRVYTADLGGADVLAPYVDLDIVELVELGTNDIWIWLNKAVRGQVLDDKGKWTLDAAKNAKVGAYCFESAHGIANLIQMDMEKRAGTGTTIGGDANTSFSITAGGETIKIGAQKGFGKYGIPQSQILMAMYESFKLPAQYVLWTAGLNLDKDEITTTKVVGPDVIGKALTGVLPKDFNYTFRLGVNPAQGGKAEEHLLYLGTHVDPQAGNAVAMGNIRRPLDSTPLKAEEFIIKPANIAKALKLVQDDAKSSAKLAIQKRLDAAKAAAAAKAETK